MTRGDECWWASFIVPAGASVPSGIQIERATFLDRSGHEHCLIRLPDQTTRRPLLVSVHPTWAQARACLLADVRRARALADQAWVSLEQQLTDAAR